MCVYENDYTYFSKNDISCMSCAVICHSNLEVRKEFIKGNKKEGNSVYLKYNYESCFCDCPCKSSKNSKAVCFANFPVMGEFPLESPFPKDSIYIITFFFFYYWYKIIIDCLFHVDAAPKPGSFIWICPEEEIFPPFFIGTATALRLILFLEINVDIYYCRDV
jgi:hypothetical protein